MFVIVFFLIERCSAVLRSLFVANFVLVNLSSNIAPENLLKSLVVLYLL